MSNPAEKEIDCSGTDEIVCAYCGHEQSDSWEYLGNDKHKGTADCGECGKVMEWEAEYSVTYSTRQVKCLNKVPCVFERETHNEIPGRYEYYRCKECGKTKFVDLEKETPNELPKS